MQFVWYHMHDIILAFGQNHMIGRIADPYIQPSSSPIIQSLYKQRQLPTTFRLWIEQPGMLSNDLFTLLEKSEND